MELPSIQVINNQFLESLCCQIIIVPFIFYVPVLNFPILLILYLIDTYVVNFVFLYANSS